MGPVARFDDQTPGSERSFTFHGLERTIVARRRDEVIPALVDVERAVAGGAWAAGFVAYEAAPAFDRALRVRVPTPSDPFAHVPLVWFGIYERRDHEPPLIPRRNAAPYQVSAWHSELDEADYDDAVDTIRGHIADGDTYQVNFTFRLRAAFSGEADEFYRDLVLAQRGAHGAYFDTGRYRVLSASPERFFSIRDGRIAARPMKGTIRRGRWSGEDDGLAARLLRSEKDRAENLMIVDLIRSDLGRIAEFGTVEVDELLALERYETLWQLTSNVSARLAPGAGLAEVFGALFPSGSVTGAPKPATMGIIQELERSPRGVYCGAIGHLAPPQHGGGAEFAVAIRTVVIDAAEGLAEYGVGGGITWDSQADAEFEEARLKAQLLVERRPDFELLETMRWEQESGVHLIDEHLARLTRSALYFGFGLDSALVTEAIEKEVAGHTEARRLRLTVARDGRVTVGSSHLDERFHDGFEGASKAAVALSDDPIVSSDVFLFHKTTNRRVYEQRERGLVDDVILTNERHELTESTTANVALRFGERWWTPPIDSGCLAGTYRERLIGEGRLRERAISVNELFSADDVALINSVRGWRRAVLVDPA